MAEANQSQPSVSERIAGMFAKDLPPEGEGETPPEAGDQPPEGETPPEGEAAAEGAEAQGEAQPAAQPEEVEVEIEGERYLVPRKISDRFIQHATAQVESGRWEPHFHPRSDELRRRCSAHESCVAIVNPHAAATAPKSTIVFTDHLRELGHIEGQNSKLRSPRYEEERKDHRLGIHSRNSLVCRLHLWTEGKRSRMAKPNYAFAKRQRDLAKKTKKEEKRLRKTGKTETPPQDTQPAPTGADNTVA